MQPSLAKCEVHENIFQAHTFTMIPFAQLHQKYHRYFAPDDRSGESLYGALIFVKSSQVKFVPCKNQIFSMCCTPEMNNQNHIHLFATCFFGPSLFACPFGSVCWFWTDYPVWLINNSFWILLLLPCVWVLLVCALIQQSGKGVMSEPSIRIVQADGRLAADEHGSTGYRNELIARWGSGRQEKLMHGKA